MTKDRVPRMRICMMCLMAALVTSAVLAPNGPLGWTGQAVAKTEGKAGEGGVSERLTGYWTGEYRYPADDGRESVKFNVILLYDGKTVIGYMKEQNTFGAMGEPWLHAACKGRLDEQTGKLTITKTYDGSAGVSHDVQYTGELSRDRSKIEGNWTIGDFSGGFTLERQRLEDRTLENLK